MGQQLGPFSHCLQPLQYCCQGGPPPGKWEKKTAHPLLQTSRWLKPRREAWLGLGPPAPEVCGKRKGPGRWGRARPAQILDGAVCAGSPMGWGTALGASNSLDRRQQLLKKLLHSCHLLGGKRAL